MILISLADHYVLRESKSLIRGHGAIAWLVFILLWLVAGYVFGLRMWNRNQAYFSR